MEWKFTNPKVFDSHTLIRLTDWEKVYRGDFVSVYETDQYMLKVVHKKHINQFWSEVRYGQMPGIEKSGVRVHAYTIMSNGKGAYIMDHASMGNPKVDITMTVEAYAKQSYFNATRFNKLFKKTLVTFYRTVRGFHGDLHDNNVLVNLDMNRKLVNIKIIDYANVTPFTRSQRLPTTYDALLKKAHRDFQQLTYTDLDEYPEGSGIRVKWQKDIPVRSNKNMLKRLPRWKAILASDGY
jgi:hypothetical protein